MIKKFKKKPVIIEAVQFNNIDDYLKIYNWMKESNYTMADECIYSTPEMHIQTLEGCMSAKPGDWIIKGVNGEFYPCKPDVFEQTYESL